MDEEEFCQREGKAISTACGLNNTMKPWQRHDNVLSEKRSAEPVCGQSLYEELRKKYAMTRAEPMQSSISPWLV